MAILPTSLNITRTGFLPPNQYSVITPSMPKRSYHRRRFITFSNKPRCEIVGNDQKREFLERYGLNPDDYLPKPSQKIKKRRGQGDSEMRNNAPVQEPKPPRETHKLLQVLGGTARRKKLLSPKSMDVRPMMEVVKGAAFSILQAAGGSPQSLKPGRWLDLYSGTGSVGIEAISRGCSQAHFVEMDPWVVTDVLQPNLESTGFLDASVIHTARVETFLENAERYLGKDASFDYISVTPPYMLVDYAVLMNQISDSSVVGENTFIVVEYPLRTEMLDSCGCSVKVDLRVVDFGYSCFNKFCMFVPGDATQVGCIKREREALLSFKDGLIDVIGILSSWRSGDCCKWDGVECSNTTGHVITLDLSDGELQGKVGSSLLELHHLNYLDLSLNYFGGNPIPKFIFSMRQLQHLNLGYTNFSGMVPPEIGNLTNLISLDLSYNSLMRISENPDWISTSLSLLSFLDLSGFDLSHTNKLQRILSLPSLHELHLKTCNLTDTKLSGDLFANSSYSTSLSILILKHNHLTFSSLDWLSNMSTSLVKLDLSHNALSGPIPNEYFERSLTLIQHLDLSSNMLEGEIPKSLWNLSHLRVLVLYNSSLRGHLDELFGNQSISGKGIMESLQILDLADNQLNGVVSEELSAFSALTELYLGGNNFTSSMPLSLGQLSKLRILDLSRNSFEGTVSESHFMKLDSLKVLDLSFNSGLKWHVIAPDWSPPFQLESIFLGGCNVGPSFPKWIKTQRYFTILDLSGAGIIDEAPRWLWSTSPILDMLWLSHNQIRGTIPNLSSTVITGLDLSYNNFSGPLPLFYADVKDILLNGNKLSGSLSSLCEVFHGQLWVIDLSNNELGGEVPDCWEKVPNLFSLSLDDNSFWGEIPPSLGTLIQLHALQLRGNKLSGELPSTLRLCQRLALIDIGVNQLTGEIPAWIGDMYKMKFVNLGRNNLHGSIPPQICNLTHIRILDMSINNLSGEIPDCFTNFTELAQDGDISYLGFREKFTYNQDLPNRFYKEVFIYSSFQWKGQESEYRKSLVLLKLIDFSSNRLSGKIPESFSSMRGLISLNLSRNSLTGNIIPDIGEMEMLECLDLSHNQLSGKIPASMAQLQSLAVLDLSDNSLSEKIPTSTQLQSFNASAYAGNHGLCGPPLASCPEDSLRPSSGTNPNDEKHDGINIFSFVQEVCISMAFGFILGFWGLIASFVLKKSWRYAYFNFLDAAGDWFHVRTAIFLSKWRTS